MDASAHWMEVESDALKAACAVKLMKTGALPPVEEGTATQAGAGGEQGGCNGAAATTSAPPPSAGEHVTAEASPRVGASGRRTEKGVTTVGQEATTGGAPAEKGGREGPPAPTGAPAAARGARHPSARDKQLKGGGVVEGVGVLEGVLEGVSVGVREVVGVGVNVREVVGVGVDEQLGSAGCPAEAHAEGQVQAVQRMAPAGEKVPAGHWAHAVLPAALLYEPAGQAAHAEM